MCGCNKTMSAGVTRRTSTTNKVQADCLSKYSNYLELEKKAQYLISRDNTNQFYVNYKNIIRAWIGSMRLRCPKEEQYKEIKDYIEYEYTKYI